MHGYFIFIICLCIGVFENIDVEFNFNYLIKNLKLLIKLDTNNSIHYINMNLSFNTY